MNSLPPAFVLAAIAPSPAFAQMPETAWQIDIAGGTVSPSNPSVTVRLIARFPVGDYALARAHADVLLGEGSWSGFRRFPHFSGPPGTSQGGSVRGIALWQLNDFAIFPNRANPIPVWEAIWTADNFRPHHVSVLTETSVFETYITSQSPVTNNRLPQLVEGEAVIRIVPAPAAAALLLVAAFAVPRRRSH